VVVSYWPSDNLCLRHLRRVRARQTRRSSGEAEMGAIGCGRLERGRDLPEYVTYSRMSSGEPKILKDPREGGLGRNGASLGEATDVTSGEAEI
jgi:hypothetical protein